MADLAKNYELSNQNELIALMVARGCSGKEIALEAGCSMTHINTLKNSPLFIMRVKQLRDELLQDGTLLELRMQRVAEESLDCISEIVTMRNVGDLQLMKLQAANAQMILAKAGFGETSNVNVNSKTQSISAMLKPEEMAELRERHAAQH